MNLSCEFVQPRLWTSALVVTSALVLVETSALVQTSALVSATQALVETSALVHIDCTVAQALVESIALGSIGGAPPPVPGCLLLEELRFEEAPADGFTLVALGCCPRPVVELGVTRLRERPLLPPRSPNDL